MKQLLCTLALWAGLVLTGPPARAQINPNVSVNKNFSTTLPSRNVALTVGISGYAQNQFVSGTNQTVLVSAAVSTITNTSGLPDWTSYSLKDVTIKIGGQALLVTGANPPTWTPAAGTTVQSVSMMVQWDTTHFAPDQQGNQAAPTVECSADAIVSNSAEGPVTVGAATVDVPVKVYNVAFSGEIPGMLVWPTAQHVDGDVGQMGYKHSCVSPAGQDDCYSPLFNATLYYFSGHGRTTPVGFGDTGLDVTPPVSAWWIAAAAPLPDVANARMGASVGGLPPITFAFINGCSTGSDSAMEAAFLYPVTVPVDEAEMGWKIAACSNWAQGFGNPFFDALQGGATVNGAMVTAYNALKALKLSPAPPDDVSQALAVYGDGSTTVHGLYKCTTGNWYSVATVSSGPSGGGGGAG